MDAPSGFLKRISLFLVIALLVAAPGWAQTLVVSPNPVALTGQNQFVSVSVTASDSSAIPFAINSITSNTTPNFFNLSATSGTTPTSLTVTGVNLSSLCALQTCSGSFVVHPTSGSAADVSVSVTFSSTGGGGGSLISLNPTSQTVNAAVGGQAQVSTQIQTSSVSSIPFTVSSDQTWLTPLVTSGNVSSSSPFTLNGIASAVTLPNGTYTGNLKVIAGGQTVQFAVTFQVGTGGGTGTSYTIGQTAVSLSYPNGPLSALVNISSNISGLTTYNASSDQSWLLVDGFNAVSQIPVSQGISITLLNPQNLTANTYTGHIAIANPNNNGVTDVTITVTLTVGGGGGGTGNLSVSPANLLFSAALNSGTTPAQNLSVTLPSGSTQFTIKSNNLIGIDVLRFNGQSCVGTCTFTGSQVAVTVLTTGLPANAYNEQFDVSSGGSTVHVPVQIQITNGSSGPLTFNPTSFSFSAPLNGSAQSGTLTVTAGSSTVWSVSPSATWLTVTNAGFSLSGSQILTVTANPAGLTANTYNGALNFSSGGQTQQVPVTFVVGSGGGGGNTSTIAAPTTLSFAFQTGAGFQVGQTVVVAPAGAYSVSAPTQGWINVSPTSGTAPAQLTVTVNPAGLTVSSTPYTGSFTVTTTAGAQTITVNLLVTSSPVLQPSPGDIIYQTGTSTYALNLTASDFSSQSATATTSDTWITLGNQQVNGSQITYFVTVNPTGLCNGLNVANININTSAANNPLVVPVVALISGASTNCGSGGGGTLTANPTSLTFSYQQGSQSPNSQTVQVTSSTGSAVSFTVSATSQGGWLTASTTSTSTPSTVTVNVNPGQLQPSATPYTGTITLTPTNGGTATTISVSLTVTAGNSVSATPSSLTFNVQAGGGTSTQSVTVSGTSGATFSAAATSTGNWLSVTPTSGSVPNTLTVSVNPANLAPGSSPYTGTITVNGTGSSTGSTTITVTANVTAPLPTITKVGNAASFVVGALAPGEVIYIEGTAIGPQTLVQASVDPATGKLATTIGGVSVTVGGFAAPMVYASANKVSAIVPYEVKTFSNSTATVVLKYLGQTSNGITFGVTAAAPGVFTANASGTGPAAAINPDLTYNSPSNPAPKGGQVAVFVTGEGETNPAGVTGKITVPPIPVPLLNVSVLVDNQPAKAVNYVGEVALIVAGVLQVNFTLPDNLSSGDHQVVVSVGSSSSQTGVTISVK